MIVNQPKVSIILPVYNVEPYIADCLQSVMCQTYQGPIECIVVDDCGTDKSMDVVERLIAEYDGTIEFSVFRHEKNLGLSCARNTGIDAATGQYIFFLDSDDLITNNCLDTLVSQLGKGDFDVVVGNNDRIGDIEGSIGFPKREGCYVVTGEQYVGLFLKGLVIGTVWNKLYKRSFLLGNDMFFEPNLLAEDHVYNFLLSCYNAIIYVIDTITYHYRIRRYSIDDKLFSDPRLYRDTWFKVWLCMCRHCSADTYVEVQEAYLHSFAVTIFETSRKNGLPFKSIYYQLHRKYPFKPLKLWLSKKQDFRWYKSRFYWSLPAFLGLCWLNMKWLKNDFVNKIRHNER